MTHKFPFLVTRVLRERVFLAWRILALVARLPVAFLGARGREIKKH